MKPIKLTIETDDGDGETRRDEYIITANEFGEPEIVSTSRGNAERSRAATAVLTGIGHRANRPNDQFDLVLPAVLAVEVAP